MILVSYSSLDSVCGERPLGVKLCRPSELVLNKLPQPQRSAFSKEDGEQVGDAAGARIT